MVHFVAILTVVTVFLVFGLLSRRLQGTVITGPMIFTLAGLIAGPAVFGLVPMQISNAALHLLAEVTLILVLFSDATNIDLRQLRRDHNLPVRMLLIGMPLTIALGALTALLFFGKLNLWEAALLAALLAPTDAALGQAVVTNTAVPVRIRQTLNVESGLNDGVTLPFVLIFAALASASQESTSAGYWLAFAGKQVTLGPIAGAAVGFVGAKLVALSYRTLWMTEEAEGIIALALAFGAFALAELIHGNGFIAVFVAGLVFGNTLAHRCQFLYEFAETEGQILILLTFLAFGSAMVPLALADITITTVVFALLALTVVRMVPVFLSLLGTGIRPVTSAFLGWFGPRGLATVLFVLLILEQADVAHKSDVLVIVVTTVMLSIFMHGISAGPAAHMYGFRTEKMGECEENRPVSEKPFSGRGQKGQYRRPSPL
jgi:NhaP-type Na+/H+ or K+/H+ antiporter